MAASSLHLLTLIAQCATGVPEQTLSALVSVESAFNPYAIGVVGGRLDRQPKHLGEALATVAQLEQMQANYSVGLGQINRSNFEIYDTDAPALFDPCKNLAVSSAVFENCFNSAPSKANAKSKGLQEALSCYYSGRHEWESLPSNGYRYSTKVISRIDRDFSGQEIKLDSSLVQAKAIPVIFDESNGEWITQTSVLSNLSKKPSSSNRVSNMNKNTTHIESNTLTNTGTLTSVLVFDSEKEEETGTGFVQ